MESTSAIATLGTRLCPWLTEPLAKLDGALESGRLGHAWLIKGPSGTGKLNLALVFAHRLLTGTRGLPPPLGPNDATAAMRERRTLEDHHPDLHRVFPEEDKRTISVEQIRAVSQSLALKGYRGTAKVAIIEPAEAMTVAAANALLKTLEEPAEGTYLLLISHQPNRLLPTIRSRCQSLVVTPPDAAAAAEWLGVETATEDPVMLLAGRAPLRAAELLQSERSQLLNELERQLHLLSIGRAEARSVADDWIRRDIELALQWLIRRLEASIRARAAPDSKGVTLPAADSLHNAWRVLPVRVLFERLEAAEKLLSQLGSGINVDLALHALLLGFQMERGRT